MIATGELEVQRRLTLAFIAADSVDVDLQRRPRTPNGKGGYTTGAPVPVAVQSLRLISSQDGAQERLMADGRKVSPAYTLMGPFGADIQRFDEFELEGRRYQVVFVNENKQYEVKGEVAYVGS